MIYIPGLTAHQEILLETLLELEETDEILEWYDRLSPNNKKTAKTLMTLVVLDEIDREVNCTSDLSWANSLIDACRK